jgi:peptidoglycan/LPS O-acetylase OafA/YrhL
METSHPGSGDRRNASISELVRSLVADVTLLARREGELARIELKGKASKAGVALGVLAAGLLVAVFALATLIAAAVLALAIVLPAWAAALMVAAALLAIAAVLLLIGRARLRAASPLAPTRTLQAVKEDIGWIQHETEQLKTSE